MIATIATVCLVASTSAANLPFQRETWQDGRDLAYTAGFQGLGERCDLRTTKTLCKQGLFCHLTSPETGICLDGTYVESTVATGPGLGEPCDVDNLCKEGTWCHILAPGNEQCVATDTTLVRKLTSRKLMGYTQSLGESCDMVSYCKSGLKCANGIFGTGKCIKRTWTTPAMTGKGVRGC